MNFENCDQWQVQGSVFDWSKSDMQIVENAIKNGRFRLCEGNSFQHTFPRAYLTKLDVIILYNKVYDVFVAVNTNIYRFIRNGKTITVSFAEAEKQMRQGIKSHEIRYVYRKIINPTNEHSYAYEKQIIIGKEALFEFCYHMNDYLFLCQGDDVKYPLLNALKTSENLIIMNNAVVPEKICREYIETTRLKRDPNFRNKVLNKWKSTCIVCGSKEVKILQAAHIIPVERGGDDSTENGICLCANHHLLFDAGILTIDFKTNTFECNSDNEKKMPWYICAEKIGKKLHT